MNKQWYLLISPLLLLLDYTYVFHLFHIYRHPLIKLACFSLLFITVAWLYKNKSRPTITTPIYIIEIALLAILLIFTINQATTKYYPDLYKSSAGHHDIPRNLQKAASVLFLNDRNPYQDTNTIPGEKNVANDPEMRGYKKGPLLIFGYSLTAYFPETGMKMSNLAYLILTIIVLILLSYNEKHTPTQQIATSLFVITLLLIPERLWFELFVQGIDDIFPALLLLVSLLFVKKKQWFWAGLTAAFSATAKFPAVLFILLFIRRKPQSKFFLGVATGLIPIFFFFLWDPAALLNNTIAFNTIKSYNATSLYSITPANLHFFFPVIQISAVLYAVYLNFHKKINYQALAVHFILLYTVIEITYTQMHKNHLILFIAFFALILSWYRHRLLCLPLSIQKHPR